LIGTFQATFRLDTFDALIGLVTSRVLSRSAPGNVHPAAAVVVGAGVGVVVEVVADVVADVVVDDFVVDVVFLLLPPQPDKATLAAMATTASDPRTGLLSNVPRISSLSLPDVPRLSQSRSERQHQYGRKNPITSMGPLR
jgi:hypothetical protein